MIINQKGNTMSRCKKHSKTDCSTCRTGRYASRSSGSDLTDPSSALYQSTYGSGYDSGSSGSSSCDGGSSSSSSSDC